jgi:hypothetical protein
MEMTSQKGGVSCEAPLERRPTVELGRATMHIQLTADMSQLQRTLDALSEVFQVYAEAVQRVVTAFQGMQERLVPLLQAANIPYPLPELRLEDYLIPKLRVKILREVQFMPHPIPLDRVVPTAVGYLARRQIARRPTTLRQLSKRMGLGSTTITGMFETHGGIVYHLVRHGNRTRQGNIEIFLEKVPVELAESANISLEELESSFREHFRNGSPRPLPAAERINSGIPGEPNRPLVDDIDPYHAYRIREDEFEVLRPELITMRELMAHARAQGYSYSAIVRAVGGDKMRFQLAGPTWRPYIFRNKRYYLRAVLANLAESDATYKYPSTAGRKRARRVAASR